MKMPFGKHRGRELDDLPDTYLRWIDEKMQVDPTAATPPEKREQYFATNRQMKFEARRILRERRRLGIKIKDDKPAVQSSPRSGPRRFWRM